MIPSGSYLQGLLSARGGEIVVLPAKDAIWVEIPATCHPKLKETLRRAGISRLYSHQAEAFALAEAKKNVLVTTGTASGKSLCYNLPVLQSCLMEPVARSLYIFPSKALAQDQASKLGEMVGDDWARIGVYDGDTKKSHRSSIREEAHIVITNPDMLHIGILPQHELWGKFLKNLQYIVVDEAHVYRGVFGAHVCGVVRRLQRLAGWRGARPRLIMTSATLAEPEEFFTKLTGAQATLVNRDGGMQGSKFLLTIPAPEAEEQAPSRPNLETARILAESVQLDNKTLAFCQARSSAELVTRYARQSLKAQGASEKLVETYRAGFLPKVRRKIEGDFFSGRLRGLASTNALELGVDVGGLDSVILNGYPGTLSSFWQQAGRAGRAGDDAVVVFIAHEDPLQQFIARFPNQTLLGRPESVHLKPEQAWILRDQLRCAAFERPLDQDELDQWGSFTDPVIRNMIDQGDLVFAAGRYTYPSHTNPAPQIALRGFGGKRFKLMVDGEVLGEAEEWRAKSELFQGAIYMHRGDTYLAGEWDHDVGIVPLELVTSEYYTQAVQQSVIETVTLVTEAGLGDGKIELWSIDVTTFTTSYRQLSFEGQAMLAEHSLTLPSDTLSTIGVRITPPVGALDLEDPQAPSAWHGVEHALTAVAPLLASCDRKDLGCAWYTLCADNLLPGIFVYDKYPGGVGIAESLLALSDLWVTSALTLLTRCPCTEGCPLCLWSPRCECHNEMLSKVGAVAILRMLAGQGGSIDAGGILPNIDDHFDAVRRN